ncbi:MAG: hypothetical protein RL407_1450 [Bacteroidota bacterium]|jgi:coproporphyrinogen III oxidase
MQRKTKEEIALLYQQMQDHICEQLEKADGKGKFKEDDWQRAEGGGGKTRFFEQGAIIEKGGVAFSAVHGPTPEKIKASLGIEEADFFATGVSVVIHPYSPMVPIIHMNIRYFELEDGVHWFGGGIDLTPHYIVAEDAAYFHRQLKSTCDAIDPTYYPRFKTWADDYFYIKHREETRGIGGIFFDRLTSSSTTPFQQLLDFSLSLAKIFPEIYAYFMHKNSPLPYGPKQKAWQNLRRGRYVEFNLVWDSGTKFGLDSHGRTESILMSMPPQAEWTYGYQAEPGTQEAFTLQHLKKGIDWITFQS